MNAIHPYGQSVWTKMSVSSGFDPFIIFDGQKCPLTPHFNEKNTKMTSNGHACPPKLTKSQIRGV